MECDPSIDDINEYQPISANDPSIEPYYNYCTTKDIEKPMVLGVENIKLFEREKEIMDIRRKILREIYPYVDFRTQLVLKIILYNISFDTFLHTSFEVD